MSVGWE